MEFTNAELETIARACRQQAYHYRELAEKTDRPIIRNQRLDQAEAMMSIAAQIEEDRRRRAIGGCTNCDD